jgi:hypothetical protein
MHNAATVPSTSKLYLLNALVAISLTVGIETFTAAMEGAATKLLGPD